MSTCSEVLASEVVTGLWVSFHILESMSKVMPFSCIRERMSFMSTAGCVLAAFNLWLSYRGELAGRLSDDATFWRVLLCWQVRPTWIGQPEGC